MNGNGWYVLRVRDAFLLYERRLNAYTNYSRGIRSRDNVCQGRG
jgi:hypothetical protein